VNFQSINQIKEQFNLESENISELKKQILQILKQIHPDNNSGEFKSESDKEKFTLLTEALEFLNNENNSEALIAPDKNTDITNFAKNALTIAEQEERINQKKDECRSVNKASSKSRYFFPRLGSGILFSFCGLIVAFAEQLKTHPLFNPILSWGKLSNSDFEKVYKSGDVFLYYDEMLSGARNEVELLAEYKKYSAAFSQSRLSNILIFLLILFLYSGLLLILTWIQERKDEAKSEWLLSEEGLRYIFKNFAAQKITGQERQKEIQFNRRELETEIKKFYEKQGWLKIPFRAKSRISPSFAEKTAKVYLEEMLNKRLIKVVEAPKFDVTYEIKREIINDLIDDKTQSE
jgi:hypothetical protein